ncbi:MAG TPA: cyclic pyranopterin monophosphate synthase MoaC [Thermopetrobacter sp.]|nr:cyclic pyranopterin monophosphate synthase MoaC [Thermopetrobacter sp.]
MSKLTHIDETGAARMVDVSQKAVTHRIARAAGTVRMNAETLKAIIDNTVKKGDVLATARIAGIMAAKKTAELIPLCHPLAITKAAVDFSIDEAANCIHVEATVQVDGKTGVEMEALSAVSVACLTIYDMVKAMQRDVEITGIRLLEKSGGKSGHYKA